MRLVRKLCILLSTIMFLFVLASCAEVKTYDDLYGEYQTHLTENIEKYQEQIDYFNHISTEVIKSVVLVEKNATSGSSTGSGVIIKSDALYYYVLTNNHVVYISSGFAEYTITDYLGNEYSATLVVRDADYDLAVLRFRKRTTVLEYIEFATVNPFYDAELAVLGYPSFQRNAITLGNVIDYGIITIEGTSDNIINVDFEVLVSDSPVKTGSSGSVVINDLFQLVGIVYAGNFIDNSSVSEYSFAIPVLKVLEFLAEKEITIGGETS